jgi:hypothetical protein
MANAAYRAINESFLGRDGQPPGLLEDRPLDSLDGPHSWPVGRSG